MTVVRISRAFGRFQQLPAGDPAGGGVAGDLLEGADAGGGTGAVTFTKWSQIRDEQIERIEGIGREGVEAGKGKIVAAGGGEARDADAPGTGGAQRGVASLSRVAKSVDDR